MKSQVENSQASQPRSLNRTTNQLLKKFHEFEFSSLDAYLLAVFLTGVFQFAYCLVVGTFPFNSFLAGFLSCVTSFVLGVCLKKTGEFKGFIFAHLVLHLAVLMLIG